MYKLILVDDETSERRLIEKIIKKTFPELDIVSFNNGFDSENYIKEHGADILLTDIRMPGMTGLELIKKVQSINQNIKIVILSGYAEFDYVKDAMKQGVHHYLVKPIDMKEFSDTMYELEREIDKEKAVYYKDVNDNFIEFFENVCIGHFNTHDEARKEFEKIGVNTSLINHIGIVAKIVIERFDENRDEEYEKGLINILNMILPYDVFGFYHKNNNFICIIMSNEIDIENIKQNFFDITGYIIKFEILTQFNDILHINIRDIFSADEIIEMLISQIVTNDYLGEKNIVRRIAEELKKNNNEREKIDTKIIYGLINECQRQYIQELNAEADLHIKYNDSPIISIVEQYIKENYNKPLTRECMAEIVNMNPSYFGRYFKKCTGMGFHEYLVNYRIEIAKKMLCTNKSIEKISFEVGFSDVKTLRRNFSTIMNMSLSEYRKKIKN